MALTNAQKSKSRSKLYNLIEGVNNISGAAGQSDTATITFTGVPTAGDQVVINGYYFEFQAGASEAAGTSAGTEADPHLVQGITDVTTVAAELVTQILAETATTGAWGVLHPVDATGASSSAGVVTLTFFPGSQTNTLSDPVDDSSYIAVTTPSGGVATKPISLEYKVNTLDTSDSATNAEYYIMPDGSFDGQEVTVAIKALGASDTPRLLGQFNNAGTSAVYAQMSAASDLAKYIWLNSEWHVVVDTATSVTYVASA